MLKKFFRNMNVSELGEQIPALCLLVMTLVAAFASLYAGGYGSKAILAQDKATDAWAYYQSCGMKEMMHTLQMEELHYDYPATADRAHFEKLKQQHEEKIAKYAKGKEEARERAERNEKERETFLDLKVAFADVVIFLQVGILFISLSKLTKQAYFFILGVAAGVIGIVKYAILMI